MASYGADVDSASLDMYHGITLSPVLSKVFESILLRFYGDLCKFYPVIHFTSVLRTAAVVMHYLH